jgi:hypothetical protein
MALFLMVTEELADKMSRDPGYKRPAWMGVGSDA